MNNNLLDVPITSKLMLLNVSATNFRSIGDTISCNLTEEKATAVLSTQNGSGKSTLFLDSIYYALLGKSPKKEETVDSLINTTRGKNLVVTLEWCFCGKYFRVVRGRKPNIFDIYSLVDNEWEEIESLPVNNRDRQDYMFSLLGMERKSADSVLNNCILLSGQRFKGFSSLPTPERRELIETVLDLGIFSQLNAETKAQRTQLTNEQKQTYLELLDVDKRVSLADQEASHKRQDVSVLEASYNERTEVLEEKLCNCTTELKEALGVDTDGGDLHVIFEEESETITKSKILLEDKLKDDLDSLGEFEIDYSDSVLVNLNKDLEDLKTSLVESENLLKGKKALLSDEIIKEETLIKSKILSEQNSYSEEASRLLVLHVSTVKETERAVDGWREAYEKSLASFNAITLLKEERTLKVSKLEAEVEEVLLKEERTLKVSKLEAEVEEVLLKEEQYQAKCDKLKAAIVYLELQIKQEEANLSSLVHIGECPKCHQQVSKDYIESLQKDVNGKISSFQVDLDTYKKRLLDGETKISELNSWYLRGELETVRAELANIIPNESEVEQAKYSLDYATKELNTLKATDPLATLTAAHELEMSKLNNILSQIEYKAKESLGEVEAEYNALVKAAPKQEANILQQIEDRKVAMKGEHAGKETLLRNVYINNVERLDEKLTQLRNQLSKDLKALVDNKTSLIISLESKKQSIIDEQSTLDKSYKEKLSKAITAAKTIEKKAVVLRCELTKLTNLHNKQQKDIEDLSDLLLLLSDKEAKSDIIKSYMIFINTKVNEYLEALGLFLDIVIDSEFNITIGDESRNGMQIGALSNGQRSRLDLSLMLTLKDLSSEKNSIDINMLVIDEVFEGLDRNGLESICLMLQEKFKNLNLFVISQRGNEVEDLFPCVKKYELNSKGFTQEVVE